MEMTQTHEHNVPVLRFPEFSGDWTSSRILELADVVTGNTPDTSNLEYYDGEIPFYSPADIPEAGGIISCSKKTLTDAGLQKVREIPAGSTLFVCIGSTIGKVARTSVNGATNQQINTVIAKKKSDSEFLFFSLCKKAPRIRELSAVQAVPIINKATFSKEKLFTPALPEQQKIASFLSSVDRKIEQLTKKKALLEQYKKGTMQKLFSQELRFKDAQGNDFPDWEEKLFSDTLKSVPTKKHQINSSQFLEEGMFPVIDQGKMLIAGYSDKKAKLFSTNGAIVYGDHTTIVKYVDYDFIVGADGTKILESLGPRIKYLFYCLSFFNVAAEGYKRHFSILKNISLPIPTSVEQQKIADFLSAIDRKIGLLATELDHAKTFKKGLLQQMFI